MAWKKKAPKGVTTWDVQFIAVREASAFLTKKAAQGAYIFSVAPVEEENHWSAFVVSCQTQYPPKKAKEKDAT